MRFYRLLTGVLLLLATVIALPGCGGQTPAKKTGDQPAVKHFEGDGHDHSKDGGDHKDHDHKEPAAK